MKNLYFTFLLCALLPTAIFAQGPCSVAGTIYLPTQARVDFFVDSIQAANPSGCTSLAFGGDLVIGPRTAIFGAPGPSTLAAFAGAPITIAGDLIIQNTNLENLINLSGIQRIDGNISILNNGVLNRVRSLGNLVDFMGKLTIESNSSLSSINGLGNLRKLTGLKIANNGNLTDCAIKSVCAFLLASPGVATIGNNGMATGSSRCLNEEQVREICQALPVTLLTFAGRTDTKNVTLEWTTTEEFDNEGFVPQRSSDGKEWTDLGFVAGNGDYDGRIDYAFVDRRAVSGTNYYRLKQLDYSGTFTFSDVVEVNYTLAEGELRLFPNPTNGQLNLRLATTDGAAVTAEVYSSLGQLIRTQAVAPNGTVDVADLATGTYLLRVYAGTTDGQPLVSRFQKF